MDTVGHVGADVGTGAPMAGANVSAQDQVSRPHHQVAFGIKIECSYPLNGEAIY